MDIVLSGLLLGGTYALIAMGLNRQYGVARIMNLANGEMLVLGGLAAFWVFTTTAISPLLTVVVVAPRGVATRIVRVAPATTRKVARAAMGTAEPGPSPRTSGTPVSKKP